MGEPPVTVFYHADCLDGFGAAYCAWRRFGDAAEYVPLHHGQAWAAEQVAGHDVYVLDFSFPRASLEALAAQANSTRLLDHHATPVREWDAVLRDDPGSGCRQHVDVGIGLTVAFDMARSGARLAWDHFFPGQPLPWAIALIEDLDLWRFAYPETRAFGRALRVRAFSFAGWDRIVDACGAIGSPARSEAYERLLVEGGAIESFFAVEVERLAASAARVELPDADGRTVGGYAVNASAIFSSELGDALVARGGEFGMVWLVLPDGRVKGSLRSRGAVDVARIAERFGGGGHPRAAGFALPLARFVETFPGLFAGGAKA